MPPPEKQDPAVRFANAKGEADRLGEWGAGDEGYKPPVNPSEKMRKNLPYKVRFGSGGSCGCVCWMMRLICSSSTSSVAAGAISDGLGKSLALDAAACSMARRDDDDDGAVLGIYAYGDDLPTHVVCAFVWIGRGAHVLFRVNYALRCVKCPCPITRTRSKVRFAGMRY